MINFENIFNNKKFCRKLRHTHTLHTTQLLASQLRLFEINQSKINSMVGLQSWTTKKRPKRLFRRYLDYTGMVTFGSTQKVAGLRIHVILNGSKFNFSSGRIQIQILDAEP